MNDSHPSSRGHPHLALCPTLIGRDAELSTLVELLAGVQRGEGTVAFILGEAGIGKSRLVRELATAACRRDIAVLTGRAVQSSSPLHLRPLTSALLTHARAHGLPPPTSSGSRRSGPIRPTSR